jgi:hypothetical protein
MAPTALSSLRVQLVIEFIVQLKRTPSEAELAALLRVRPATARGYISEALALSDKAQGLALSSVFGRATKGKQVGTDAEIPKGRIWRFSSVADLDLARRELERIGRRFLTQERKDGNYVLVVEPGSVLTRSSSEAPSTSVTRAKDLMDLIKSPTAVATGVMIAFARGQLIKNRTGIDKPMTWWAFIAAVAAVGIAGLVVAVMSPLAWSVVVSNRGSVDTTLLVYCITYVVAIGTAIYSGFVAWRCTRDLH